MYRYTCMPICVRKLLTISTIKIAPAKFDQDLCRNQFLLRNTFCLEICVEKKISA